MRSALNVERSKFMRTYRRFTHRGAKFRVACDRFGWVIHEIVRQRRLLERYLLAQPAFLTTLVPIRLLPGAPEAARRMAAAARRVGVGPMAAVAGCMAQLAAETALAAGAREAIIDNGGDIYIAAAEPLTVTVDAGEAAIGDRLAFAIRPEETPLAICSSSGKMGHSLSLGSCDLATVVARDAALADAAATLAGNLVKQVEDVDAALNRIAAIRGVRGVLIVKDDRVGLAGRLPRLVRRG